MAKPFFTTSNTVSFHRVLSPPFTTFHRVLSPPFTTFHPPLRRSKKQTQMNMTQIQHHVYRTDQLVAGLQADCDDKFRQAMRRGVRPINNVTDLRNIIVHEVNNLLTPYTQPINSL